LIHVFSTLIQHTASYLTSFLLYPPLFLSYSLPSSYHICVLIFCGISLGEMVLYFNPSSLSSISKVLQSGDADSTPCVWRFPTSHPLLPVRGKNSATRRCLRLAIRTERLQHAKTIMITRNLVDRRSFIVPSAAAP